MFGRLCNGIIWLAVIATATSVGPMSQAEEPVLLGALYNSTGAQAGLDVPSARGARLAVEQANEQGGVLGRKIELGIRDGKSIPDFVQSQTRELLALDHSPVALFGLSDTDLVLAAAPLAAQDKRVFLTSGATSPRLPAQVPEYLFLACFGDNLQASAAAEWAYQDQAARTAIVLFDSSHEYTRLLQKYFQERFKQLGGKIVTEIAFTSASLEKTLTELPQADIVFLSAEDPADIRKSVRKIRDQGLECPILGGDSFDSEGLWQQSENTSDIFYTTHAYLGEDNRNPRVVKFREAYMAAYPDSVPDAFASLGYDAALLLIDSIKRAESTDPELIRQALAKTQRFEGVTGTISYANDSRIPSKSVSLIGVKDGELRLVEELLPKNVPAP